MAKSKIYHTITTSRKKFWKSYLLTILFLGLFLYLHFYIGFNTTINFILLGIALIILGITEFKHLFGNKLYVANYGIRKEEGTLNKKYVDIDYKNILRIIVTQSLIGRALNYGNIELDVAGMGEAAVIMKDIPKPLKYKKIIDDIVESVQHKKRK